jgi:hypothetical protein
MEKDEQTNSTPIEMSDDENNTPYIYIKVYTIRPENFEIFLERKDGTPTIQETLNTINIGVTMDMFRYMGPVVNDLVNKSDSDHIDLGVIDGVNEINYHDNLYMLFNFIRDVISEFSDSDIERLNSYVGTYHKFSNNKLFTELQRKTIKFAKENNIFGTDTGLTSDQIKAVYDFAMLCYFLQIGIGVIAAASMFRIMSRLSNPMQINDIMVKEFPSHEDNVNKAKRVIFILKNPAYLYEPSDEQLASIDVNITEGIDINYQINCICEAFLEKQSQRINQFNQYIEEFIKVNPELTPTQIMEIAKESNIINEDDINKIMFDDKKNRFLMFHEKVTERKKELKRNLLPDEFDVLKAQDTNLLPDDKNSDFRVFYEMVTDRIK